MIKSNFEIRNLISFSGRLFLAKNKDLIEFENGSYTKIHSGIDGSSLFVSCGILICYTIDGSGICFYDIEKSLTSKFELSNFAGCFQFVLQENENKFVYLYYDYKFTPKPIYYKVLKYDITNKIIAEHSSYLNGLEFDVNIGDCFIKYPSDRSKELVLYNKVLMINIWKTFIEGGSSVRFVHLSHEFIFLQDTTNDTLLVYNLSDGKLNLKVKLESGIKIPWNFKFDNNLNMLIMPFIKFNLSTMELVVEIEIFEEFIKNNDFNYKIQGPLWTSKNSSFVIPVYRRIINNDDDVITDLLIYDDVLKRFSFDKNEICINSGFKKMVNVNGEIAILTYDNLLLTSFASFHDNSTLTT